MDEALVLDMCRNTNMEKKFVPELNPPSATFQGCRNVPVTWLRIFLIVDSVRSFAGYDHTKELIRIRWESPVDFSLLEKMIEFNIMDKGDCSTFWRK